MFERVAYEKWSGRKLYHWLRFELNFRTKNNHHLALSNIYIILQNHLYYGVYEWPQGSGNWYNGKHEPLITKELFDQVQDQIKRDRIVRETKEFAFTKLILCGHCGSGITADEKYKKLKDGTVSKYIYYGCTRARDMNCKGGYIEEKALIAQLLELMDKIDLDKSGIKKKLEVKIERHKKFHSGIMGKPDTEYSAKDADIRNYAKYLLSDGSLFEKRDLIQCLKSRLSIREKTITLAA